MKYKKLYLNIIKGELQVREYKTKKNVFSFTWYDVIKFFGKETCIYWNNAHWHFYINDIYDYLIHGEGLVYVDSFGHDRLTDKGLKLFWQGRRVEA